MNTITTIGKVGLLLVITITASLIWTGCQKEQINEAAIEDNNSITTQSTQKRRARGDLFPKNKEAYDQVLKFDSLINGKLSSLAYGKVGTDTAIWILEAYANFKNPLQDSMIIDRVDSGTVRIDVAGGVVQGSSLINSWNDLNNIVNNTKPGDPANMKAGSIIADVRGTILQDGSFQLSFYIAKLVPSLLDPIRKCKFNRNECIHPYADPTCASSFCPTTYKCNPADSLSSNEPFTRQVLTKVSNCLFRLKPRCRYYTGIIRYNVGPFFNDAFPPHYLTSTTRCICGPDLNAYIDNLNSLIPPTGTYPGDLIAVELAPKYQFGPTGLPIAIGFDIVLVYGFCRTGPNPLPQ